MVFRRQWLLLFGVLLLGGGPLFAASREERAYAAALAAFQDKIWDRAETQFAQFARNYRQSTNVPMARLLQAQAVIKQGRFAEASTLLAANHPAAGKLADQYVRWLGEAQYGQGNFSAAAETFAGLVRNFPDSPLNLGAVIGAAAAREKLGEWSRVDELLGATNGVFARTAQLDPDNELIASGRLLLAQSQYSQKNFSGARAVLDLLNPQTLPPDQDFKRLHLLCRVKLALNDLTGAQSAAEDLRQVARRRKNAEWQAEGVALHGRVLGERKIFSEAIAVWAENLTNAVPAVKQQEAILSIALLAANQKNQADAAAALDRFVAQFPKSSAAELALLTAGELCLRDFAARPAATNLLAAAQSRFDQVLGVSTNSPLAGRAFLGRGWCRWLAGATNDSLADFQSAALRLPASEDLAVAKFKVGDALFLQGDFSGATNSYHAVLEDFGGFPAVASSLGDRALYQVLRANLQLQDVDGAAAALRRLLNRFPNSELADNSLLLVGEALSDFGRPANAREVLLQFEKQFPDSPLKPEVEFVVARTFEREQNWRAAITGYGNWLKSYPTNDLLPSVKFALAQATFHAGDEAGAFRQFTAFVARFTADTNAPLAQWWVADYYFRATNFAGVENYFAAETNYENIFQNPAWKNSALVYPAKLMAGRAAVGRQGFSDAGRYFTKLIDDTINDTNCPPELGVQARFAYGAALLQTTSSDTNNSNLQLALNLFSQICRLCPTNEAGALAWSETGDCQLQLGDFDAATNAYAQVLNSPVAGSGLRGRAQVGVGLALEKKAALLPERRTVLLRQALDCYLNLIYTADEADPFWQKKAGLQALRLLAAPGDRNPEALDKFFNRLEKCLPQLTDDFEKKRAFLVAPK
ncbi:MAG: tetratricopeptide repeat protein [Verrucomicrobiota bacterium]